MNKSTLISSSTHQQAYVLLHMQYRLYPLLHYNIIHSTGMWWICQCLLIKVYSALTTATNPAYEMMKQGGQGSHEYELWVCLQGLPLPLLRLQTRHMRCPLLPPISLSLPYHCLWPRPLVGMWVWLRKARKRVCMTTFQEISDHITSCHNKCSDNY